MLRRLNNLFRHALAASALPLALANAQSGDVASFTVGDIRVEGLQRVSEGTVFNYLPVNIGDVLSAQRVREAIRALYQTGFFRDVQLRRDGSTLIVVVAERPSIESFEITGNKDIKTEELQKSLRNVGLATGKTFDRSVLEEVQRYLTDQYFSRGKYGVRVETEVQEQPGNRVRVKINIHEGKRAKIRQINIVGNESFTDEQILEEFQLKTPNWLSWYRQDDRYSRESLQGDLEKLRSFYMDRGYANFEIESTQVQITPEKDDIFITINVNEGEVYTISEVKLSGSFVVPEDELRRFLLVQPGQTFSRRVITATQELLQNRLGTDGYAFAKVDPIPTPVEGKGNEISLTFIIDPGNRVYVRNISFVGADGINDEVLRRQLRQLEGAWLSNVSLERSKQRLQRLPFIKTVEFETTPVPGAPDLVDVEFELEELPSASLSGGVGYSETQSFLLNGSYSDSNFLGTGQRISVDLNAGSYYKQYGFTHTDPYISIDEVGRTMSVAYRDVTQFVSSSSDLSSETITASLSYSYPITEFQTVQFGAAVQRAEIVTSQFGSAQQAIDWVRNNGDSFTRVLRDDFGGTATVFGTRLNALELTAGWYIDTRNRTLFPDSGMRHSFSLSAAVPGSDAEYMVAVYDSQQYFRLPIPLIDRLPFSFGTRIAYAFALGDTTAPPPYRNFFVGGIDTVRGFDDGTLGPIDSLGNPYGGDFAVTGQFEALLPMPQKFRGTAQVSLFYDFGQGAYLGDAKFTNKRGFPIDYDFDIDRFRTSTGIAVQWLSPMGVMRFSYAFPLRYRRETELNYGDEIERFQFSFGASF